jgi:hypothetical protein
MKVENILTYVIRHILNHVCEPCKEFLKIHFKKGVFSKKIQ